MYTDGIAMFTQDKTKEQAASKLTAALNKVSNLLTYSCLIFNMSTTVAMYFSIKRHNTKRQSSIFAKREVINTVDNLKYLGVIVDSNLTVKKHIASLANFGHTTHRLPLPAAKLFLHSNDLFTSILLLYKLVPGRCGYLTTAKLPLKTGYKSSWPPSYYRNKTT